MSFFIGPPHYSLVLDDFGGGRTVDLEADAGGGRRGESKQGKHKQQRVGFMIDVGILEDLLV